jgi:hypothetical protein
LSLDRLSLLEWLVAREREEPGTTISGRDLLPRASVLCSTDPTPWKAVARAVGELMQLECISWRHVPYPDEPNILSPQLLNDRTLQQVDDIMVTTGGLTHLANVRPVGPGIQITVSGGQVAFGNIQNIDIAFLLSAAEGKLNELDVPEDAREEARGVLRRMGETAMSVGSTAAGSVVAAAIRQVLGLP